MSNVFEQISLVRETINGTSFQSFILRLKREAEILLCKTKNNGGGIAVISATIVIDHNGNPIMWMIDEGRKIEPGGNAFELIKAIVSNTTH